MSWPHHEYSIFPPVYLTMLHTHYRWFVWRPFTVQTIRMASIYIKDGIYGVHIYYRRYVWGSIYITDGTCGVLIQYKRYLWRPISNSLWITWLTFLFPSRRCQQLTTPNAKSLPNFSFLSTNVVQVHSPIKAQWSLYVPSVQHSTIPRSAHTVYLCVLCGSENKQRSFPYTALTDWFV